MNFCRFGQPIHRCENRTELRRRVVRAFENLANGFGGVNQMIRIVTLVELHSIVTLRHCRRSEEHTSELQSLMRISYAVFCLKKKKLCSLMTYINKRRIHTIHNQTIQQYQSYITH